MTSSFHRNLNRMSLFTTVLVCGLILFWRPFLHVAASNIVLNGIIIGTAVFGIGLCFVEMFRLLPEYKWMRAYFAGRRAALPPRLLRPVAIMLNSRPRHISANTLQGFLDMILIRFEDAREAIRYITNTLIFLGLLGTFWGLILTVDGFAELIAGLNFSDESVMLAMQAGLAQPLSGMATAFTSSLLGLAGSLSIGFLGLQVQLAQNAIFRELEDYLSTRVQISQMDSVTRELNDSVVALNKTVTELTTDTRQ